MRFASKSLSLNSARFLLTTLTITACLTVVTLNRTVANAKADNTNDTGFSLQVSPSPLVATVKPGTTTKLQLEIRNTNSEPQILKMGLRAFTVNDTTGQIKLSTSEPSDIANLVTFSDPTFEVQAGQIFTQYISIAIPSSAGFTYSFAVSISQANPPKAQEGKSAIQGSVAVFTLLNVDKPGAVRRLELTQVSVSKHSYEYLPATITIKLKNTGNTLAQPKGTIFIQRNPADKQPLASININQENGYILPGATRTFTAVWNDGFPHYTKNETDPNKQTLDWQGGDITNLRIGRYIAKVVAVYDDGTRDVPLTSQVSFWIIPWRLIFVALLAVILIIIGAATTISKSTKTFRHKKTKKTHNPDVRS